MKSKSRLGAVNTGWLAPALDAAKAADATDSISKMLVHQMTASHHSAMRCIEHSQTDRLPIPEVTSLLNTAARMMDSYRSGIATLLKLKTGGKQKMQVQRIHIQGQAVVAQNLKTGERRLPSPLKNGNRQGDFTKAPRCGAKTRHGTKCQCPGMKPSGRCRLHGGLSTGPRTLEGIERIRKANTKHGAYSMAARAQKKADRQFLREMRALLRQIS